MGSGRLIKNAHLDRPIEPIDKKVGKLWIQIKTNASETGHHPQG
jgi:hypothetical protein